MKISPNLLQPITLRDIIFGYLWLISIQYLAYLLSDNNTLTLTPSIDSCILIASGEVYLQGTDWNCPFF